MGAVLDFEPWPKIPRLRRDVVITEKIDGTNAQVCIRKVDSYLDTDDADRLVDMADYLLAVRAGSRTRWISPGKTTDNYGFAEWVHDNALSLCELLGEGRHFGEWWGSGIQRGYGLENHRMFSLFNTHRWADLGTHDLNGVVLGVVPELHVGPWSDMSIDGALNMLRKHGSEAMPGYMNPEGIVLFHTAASQTFKVLLEGDELPKGQTTRAERDALEALLAA